MLGGRQRVVTERFRGAPHTVAHIRALAKAAVAGQSDYQIRLLSEEIVGGLDSKDYCSEILAVYNWVLANVRYANDPRNVELVRSPNEVLARISSAARRAQAGWRPSLDCDDIVTLLVALFLVLGREAQIVTVAFNRQYHNGELQYQHVLVRVKEPRTGVWIILDPVAAEDTKQMLGRVAEFKIWPV